MRGLIVGFGSQGRNHALNLRDSGVEVVIDGRDCDKLAAQELGFEAYHERGLGFDFLFILAPDHLHHEVYSKHKHRLNAGCLIVVAHGFSTYYSTVNFDNYFDVVMLAPRMPGAPIREAYEKGEGIPAFVDIINDHSGNASKRLHEFGKLCGYDHDKWLWVSVAEETEIDLFIEQYFLPKLFELFNGTFTYLTDRGFKPELVALELFASGELSELLNRSAGTGIYSTWSSHASPTCRFGIHKNLRIKDSVENEKGRMEKTLEEIRSGDFFRLLQLEQENKFKFLAQREDEHKASKFEEVLKKL